MSFRPYVSRSQRIYRYCDATFRWLMKEHAEKVIFTGSFGTVGFLRFIYLYSNSNGLAGGI